MNALPSPTLHFFKGRARVLVPALVVPEDVSIGFCHPGELRNAVRHGQEPLFTLAQRTFRSLSLGNVLHDSKHSYRVPGGLPVLVAAGPYPSHLAIQPNDSAFEFP